MNETVKAILIGLAIIFGLMFVATIFSNPVGPHCENCDEWPVR